MARPEHEEDAERELDRLVARGDTGRGGAAGRPLDLSDRGDPAWWIKRRLRDEEHAPLPPALQLRRDRDDLLARLPTMRSERQVREALEHMDGRIRYALRHAIPGPPSNVPPLDVDALVAAWRAQRPPPPREAPPPPPRSRWRRLRDRLRRPA